MATRVLSRRAMREQHDQAEQAEPTDQTTPEAGTEVKKKRTRKAAAAKPAGEKAPPKPRAARKKAVKVPPRMCARWAVYDNGMKRIAVFDYKDRADADAKLAEVRERKAGSTFFLQMVKEPYDPPVAAEPVPAV